jgi:branched-chain amino acid transport system substrate-binding protein
MLVGSAQAQDKEPILIGGLATLEGAFAVLGEDSMRGIEMALAEFDHNVAGHPLKLVKGSSDGSPGKAVNAARRLIEQEDVDILVGPLSGSEGLAVKDYAKNHLDKTFVNGSSGAQDTTLRDPAPNFYRFSTDGAQWMAGLGNYAYDKKGYRRVVVVGEDYSFPYTQVFGFMAEFCSKGGHVVDKYWVPIGNKDYSSVIAQIPDNIDAIYVMLGGSDAVNFLSQYRQMGGEKPMIGSSVTVDQTVLSGKGMFKDYLVGTPSAGPIADSLDTPEWNAFKDRYHRMFPDGFGSPSLFAFTYYVNAKAALLALKKVGGDLSDGEKQLQKVLADVSFETPVGPVKLDQNRQAIAPNFVTEVARAEDGSLYNKVVRKIDAVNQTLGMDREKFLALGRVGRNNPSCP